MTPRIDVWFEPSAAASPVPITIFEGDVSAQVAADRVLDLNFDLPSTGVLEFVGDTASLDADPQLDTVGVRLVSFGSVRCSDLQGLPGITEVQAERVDWETYPAILVVATALFNAGTTEEVIETLATRSVGLYSSKIIGDAGKLALKLGYSHITSTNIKDLAPIIIRWIP